MIATAQELDAAIYGTRDNPVALAIVQPTRYPYPAAWDVTPAEFAAFLATFNRGDDGTMDTSTVREKRDNEGREYSE